MGSYYGIFRVGPEIDALVDRRVHLKSALKRRDELQARFGGRQFYILHIDMSPLVDDMRTRSAPLGRAKPKR